MERRMLPLLDENAVRDHVQWDASMAALAPAAEIKSREAAHDQCGDGILSSARIHAVVGEILAGDKPARADETTVMEAVGIAVDDIPAGRLVSAAGRGGTA